jgi:transposase
MVADKAYDCADLRAWCQKAEIRSHLPTRRNSRHRHRVDRDCYRQRQVVERFFCRLKQFRRVATRYDRLLMTWAATVALALVRVMVTAGQIGGMG